MKLQTPSFKNEVLRLMHGSNRYFLMVGRSLLRRPNFAFASAPNWFDQVRLTAAGAEAPSARHQPPMKLQTPSFKNEVLRLML
jgi:hypothetical protein